MPRKTSKNLRFKPPEADDLKRSRRALELILGQDVSQEDATDGHEVDRYGKKVE